MATISSTWTFSHQGKPVGCGVDLETIDRFSCVLEDDAHPMPFVFTRNEIDHARIQHGSACALSACFTVKEAVRKALRAPYNFTECELFPIFIGNEYIFEGAPILSDAVKQAHGLSGAAVRCSFDQEAGGEMLTAVILFEEEKS
jgi:phosphopantetheinyl transferase (holo-ACP synthase)